MLFITLITTLPHSLHVQNVQYKCQFGSAWYTNAGKTAVSVWAKNRDRENIVYFCDYMSFVCLLLLYSIIPPCVFILSVKSQKIKTWIKRIIFLYLIIFIYTLAKSDMPSMITKTKKPEKIQKEIFESIPHIALQSFNFWIDSTVLIPYPHYPRDSVTPTLLISHYFCHCFYIYNFFQLIQM